MRSVQRGGDVPGWEEDDYQFFILDRTQAKKFKDFPRDSRNGYWMLHQETLYVSCPKCANLSTLKGFYIELDGTVDTDECIHCLKCGVHWFGILKRWTPACIRRRKK